MLNESLAYHFTESYRHRITYHPPNSFKCDFIYWKKFIFRRK